MDVRRIEGRDDVRGLIRAHGRAWREAYDGLLPEDVLREVPVDPGEAVVGQWQEGLAENREGVLVAVEEGTVLGFVDLRWGDAGTKEFVGEDEADLKAIHVDPDHWNRGVGTALLEAGLARLPDWVEAVRLEMFADNDVAAPFYESRGFEPTGTGEYEIGKSSYPTVIYTREL